MASSLLTTVAMPLFKAICALKYFSDEFFLESKNADIKNRFKALIYWYGSCEKRGHNANKKLIWSASKISRDVHKMQKRIKNSSFYKFLRPLMEWCMKDTRIKVTSTNSSLIKNRWKMNDNKNSLSS